MGLFAKKPLAELRVEAEKGTLRRALGPVSLTALGIGSVIGTGIFVLTGTAASQNAGPALVISMVIAAAACALAGLCYAELASMIPVAGSAYTYAYVTVGELLAWIIGWDLMLEYALSAATIAVGWSGYFVSLMHDLGVAIPAALTTAPGTTVTLPGGAEVAGAFNLPAAVIVLLVCALLLVGIKESANANAALVVVKVLVLIVFVVAGAAYINRENLTPFIPPNTGEFGHYGWSGILRGAGVIFFAFIGFDAVSTAAQEAKNPQRDMPIGILVSLAICTVLYIAVAIVLTGIVHYSKLDVASPLAVGIDATGLTWLSPFIKVSALFGMFSTMVVQLIGQTRIFYSMSRDGLLPAAFGRVHPRFRTPYLSTLLTSGVIAVAAGLLPITVLSQLVSMGTLLAFVLACVGILILRRTAPELERPFRTPGMPWVPILGALACLAQMVGLPWTTWERLIIWLALGLAVYFLYSRRRAAEVRGERAGMSRDEGRLVPEP
ncbi:MAG TPA: amino acid permease [Gemmatimonadaceae bacterium]|nr:amino acid permease [Gemmatimonadaceae bacterium]